MIKIWNLETLVCETILIGHIDEIQNVSVSDQSIISTSLDGHIRIWKDGFCTIIKICDDLNEIIIIENKIIVSYFHNSVMKIFSAEDGPCLGTLIGHSNNVISMKQLPNGHLFTRCDHDCKIWDLKSLECLESSENLHSYFPFIYPFGGKSAFLTNDRNSLVMYQ